LCVTAAGDRTAKDKIAAAPFCQYETARQGCGVGLGLHCHLRIAVLTIYSVQQDVLELLPNSKLNSGGVE